MSAPTADLGMLGRYRLVREIARSNDIVYEALDPTMKRRVAIKELWLPPTLQGAAREERRERFRREARAAGSLTHPNIVTLYDVGEDRGRPFVAMEYLEGPTLRQVLQMERTLPPHRAVEIALQVLAALALAHSHSIVHRDVKPDNVHLQPDGLVKLTDFGIARVLTEPSVTATGQVFGTPSYMSPEQVAGRPVDARSDLFSLGVMLYEMVAGEKPFTGDSVITITYRIMSEEVKPPPGVPAGLWAVIRRALEKDPALRYASAEEMAAALRSLQFSGSLQASASPAPAGASPAAVALPGAPSSAEATVLAAAPGAGAPAHPPPGGTALPGGGDAARPLAGGRRRSWAVPLLAAALLVGAVVGGIALIRPAYQAYSQVGREEAARRALERAVFERDPVRWWEILRNVANQYPDTAAGQQAKRLLATQPGQRPAAPAPPPDARRPEAPAQSAQEPRVRPLPPPAASWTEEFQRAEAAAQSLLRQAQQAERAGDLDAAKRLYQEAEGANPGGRAALIANQRKLALERAGR